MQLTQVFLVNDIDICVMIGYYEPIFFSPWIPHEILET